jgi:hypothetical protein
MCARGLFGWQLYCSLAITAGNKNNEIFLGNTK